MRIKYTGEAPERVLWGRVFERNKSVTLEQGNDFEAALAHKALCVGDFVEVKAGRKKASTDEQNEA